MFLVFSLILAIARAYRFLVFGIRVPCPCIVCRVNCHRTGRFSINNMGAMVLSFLPLFSASGTGHYKKTESVTVKYSE